MYKYTEAQADSTSEYSRFNVLNPSGEETLLTS